MVRLEQLKRDEANQHDNTQGVGGSAASSVLTRSGRRQGQDPRRVVLRNSVAADYPGEESKKQPQRLEQERDVEACAA